jgi:hypothetical protein
MSVALWLAASAESLELDLLNQVGQQALAHGGRGAAAWLATLTERALASPGPSALGRSLAELAVAAAHAQPSQLEAHLPKLVPVLVARVAEASGNSSSGSGSGSGSAAAVPSGVRGGAVAVLSAVFGRWDELDDGRGALLTCLGTLVPALCAAARANDATSEGIASPPCSAS